MWTGKDKAMPGYMMGYGRFGPNVSATMEEMNYRFPVSTSDGLSVDESSRKRKMADLDKGGGFYDAASSVYRGNMIHDKQHMPGQAGLKHELGQFQVRNTRTSDMYMNQSSHFVPPNNTMPQQSNYPVINMNNFPNTLQTSDTIQKATVDNSMPQAFQHQEHSAMGNKSVIEIPRLPYSQHFTYNVASQASKFQPHSSDSTASMGSVQANLIPNEGTHSVHGSHVSSSHTPLVTSSRSLTSSEFSQQGMPSNEMLPHSTNLDEKLQFQDLCNTGSRGPEYARTSQEVNVAGSRDMFCFQVSSTPSYDVSQRENLFGSSMNEIRSSVNNLDSIPQDFVRPERTSAAGDAYINSVRSATYIPGDIESKNSKNQDDLDKEERPSENQYFSSLDGEGKPFATKAAPAIVGNLWDGTLQLNTSTTVSALAFFRSGEKATDIDWPPFIEVKGKVRLEAFEKFIQELPRSRNRALMVISLCWKIGSSETGLTGIKEVAKGYKEGQRVGYAQLSPGIDLYVCPRSEIIITILAKYGFFKGMAAVEEDQDSLIGCVVWRRNHTLSNVVSKKSEIKKFSSDKSGGSPSESTLQNVELNSPKIQESESNQANMCIREPPGSSASHISAQSLAIESARSIFESKNIHPSIATPSVRSGTVEQIQGATPLVNYNSPAISMQLPTSLYPCSSSSEVLVKHTADTKIQTWYPAEPKKPDMPFNPRTPTLSRPSESISGAPKNSADCDDDDLPEFDFGIACGAQQASGSRVPWSNQQPDFSIRPPCNNQVLVEENMKSGRPMPPASPASRPMDVRPIQAPPYSAHAFPTHQGITQAKKVGEVVSESEPAAHPAELSSRPVSHEVNKVSASQGVNYARKNIWDDGDDMPEWCPPELEREDLPPPQPPLPPGPPPFPPLPRGPRPPPPTVARPLPPILQPPPEMAPPWPPLPSHSQMYVQPPNNQGLPPGHGPGLLGREPPNSNPLLPGSTRPYTRFFESDVRLPPGIHPDENLRNQSSGFEVKHDRRHSPGPNPKRISRLWQSGFSVESDRQLSEHNHNETFRNWHSDFNEKRNQDLSPGRKSKETSRRRRTGFDVLPESGFSPRFSPKQTSRRRRPSLFDVKPDSSNFGRRG